MRIQNDSPQPVPRRAGAHPNAALWACHLLGLCTAAPATGGGEEGRLEVPGVQQGSGTFWANKCVDV